MQHALLFALVVAEVIQRQWARALVDVGKCLVQILVRHDRQQRPEDFVLHHRHLVRDIEQQAMAHAAALALVEQRHQQRTLAGGVADIAIEARQLSLIDDRGVVRIVDQRRIKPADGGAVGFDETSHAILRHQHIVRGYAGLAGVQGFTEGDALGGVLERYIAGNDGRGLAAQLKGHRGQVFRSGAHHVFADAGGAGEQQVIERQT
ncbi:hypothetical protein D3C73_1174020 [compost metagenome]